MKNISLLIFSLLSFSHISTAQLQQYSDGVSPGYVLFEGWTGTYLVNNCGEIVHQWSGISSRLHPKLHPNGNIFYIESETAHIKEVDWDGITVNDIEIMGIGIHPDYEIIKLHNGNYLMVGRKQYSTADFEAIGYPLGEPSTGGVGFPTQIDVVIEVNAQDGEIVWMWNIGDHVIQENVDTLANYGIVKDHPELLNMSAISTFDWTTKESFMINGLDYNAELDQIILSIRKMSEVIIIDHSTTTEEAAGHEGGNSGKGGDILYRWGNPQNYNRGTAENRSLYFQHSPFWIQHGEHQVKFACYNNGLNRTGLGYYELYSGIPIINIPLDTLGNYEINPDAPFLPIEPDIEYSKVGIGPNFFSRYGSGVRVMKNGNIFITSASEGKIIELIPNGTKVWEYWTAGTDWIFRTEKYPLDYPAFDGKDLTPMGTIEDPSSSVPCDLNTGLSEYFKTTQNYNIWSDITTKTLYIETESTDQYRYRVVDMMGKIIIRGEGKASLNLSLDQLIAGNYAVQIVTEKNEFSLGVQITIP